MAEFTERTGEEFLKATANSVNHAKRSLLDFLDFQEHVLKGRYPDLDLVPLFVFLKKRVHNDVSVVRDQVEAAFQILQNGGKIPPFGRSDQDRADAAARRQDSGRTTSGPQAHSVGRR